MKRTKRISVFVFALILLSSSVSAVAFAQTESNAYISAVGAGVTTGGNGLIYVDYTVIATGTMNKVGVSTILLYTTEDDKIGNSDDKYVTSFLYIEDLYRDQMMATNTYRKVSYVEYQGVVGKKYYAELTFYAENDDGFGTMPYTTRITTAK